MVTPRQAPSAGSLSVKKTLCQRSWRRSSVTSPSTHTVGRRASQSPMPRLNDETVNTRRSPYSIDSNFTPLMLRRGARANVPAGPERAPSWKVVPDSTQFSPRLRVTLTAGGGRKGSPPGWGARVYLLEQDLRRGLRLAALSHELDGAVQVGVAVGEPFCERERIPRLDQDMEPPARDLLALVLIVFDDLRHVAHW